LGGNLTKLWRCRPGSAFLWQPRNVMRKREAAVLKGDDQRGGLGYDAHAHRNGCAKFVVKASRGAGTPSPFLAVALSSCFCTTAPELQHLSETLHHYHRRRDEVHQSYSRDWRRDGNGDFETG